MRYARFHAPAVLLALSSSLAVGADVSWIASGQADFGVGANWSTGTVPTATDVVILNQPSNSIRLTNEPAAVITGEIRIVQSAATFSQLGTGGGSHVWNHGGIVINGGSLSCILDGRLVGPSLDAVNGFLNAAGTLGGANGPSNVRFSGLGARWNAASISVGRNGSAELIIEDGAQLTTSGRVSIGSDVGSITSGAGTVIIRGAGSSWRNIDPAGTTGTPVIGDSVGGGWMRVESGASIQPKSLIIGRDLGTARGASGTLEIAGSNSGMVLENLLVVGYGVGVNSNLGPAPSGYMSITGGSTVTVGGTEPVRLGYLGGTGTLVVSGLGSTFDTTRQLNVGMDGRGAVHLSNGAVMTSGIGNSSSSSSGVIGSTSDTTGFAQGIATVSGAGTAWKQSGTLSVGFSHTGTLVVSNGGLVQSVGGWVGRNALGTAIISGNGSLWDLSGNLNISAATVGFAAGSLVIDSGATVVAAGTCTVAAGGAVRIDSGKLRVGALSVPGGRISIVEGTESVVRTTAASNSLGGAVDIADRGLIVDYEWTGLTPFTALRNQIISGRAGGSWSGPGITSSSAAADPLTHGVGIIESVLVGLTSMFGETFDDSTVVIRHTLLGDANLDGAVTIGDFSTLAFNFNLRSQWYQGDFNYSGWTDIADFALLAQNFNQSLPASRSTVPEPASTVCALFVIANLQRRRV